MVVVPSAGGFNFGRHDGRFFLLPQLFDGKEGFEWSRLGDRLSVVCDL